MQPTVGVALLTLGPVLLVTTPGRAQGSTLTPDQSLARDILAELIGINTTHDHGNTIIVADAVDAAELRSPPQRRGTPSQ